MTRLRLADLVPLGFYVGSALVLLWNIVLAGRIAQLRRAPRAFRGITALAGLLIAPAALIAVASESILDGRAIYVVAWVWPATLLIFAAQAIYATTRRLITAFFGVPIAIYDLLLAVTAITRYMGYVGTDAPAPALAFSAAQASTLGFFLGRVALYSPLALPLPLLAPAYPAVWRISRGIRATLAAAAAIGSFMLLLELPQGYRAVLSYRAYASERLRERPRGDFTVGLRIFPELRDAPPPLALRSDLALVDSVDFGAISVVIDPDGVRAQALDSLARSVDQQRRDSVLLVVGIGYSRTEREAYAQNPTEALRARVALVDLVARRLRPDILLPAVDPYTVGTRALGAVPVDWWKEYLRLSARAAHRVSRDIRVGVAAAAFSARDSTLYAWAASPDSPLDVVGFSLYPSYDGGAALAARMRVAERWLRHSRKDNWVFGAGGFPLAHGEASQDRALWGVLAWATARDRIKGLIVDGAGDYGRTTGLRAPSGRLRPAAAMINRAIGALEETRGS